MGRRSKARSEAAQVPPGTICLQLSGRMEYRNVALGAVADACKLVTSAPHGRAWRKFQTQVLSAVGEGFNNVVLHGKLGRKVGSIEMRIVPRRGHIRIEIRDWGPGFDPSKVSPPALEKLPESGLGLHIMQSFMSMSYRSGPPNLLTLRKRLEPAASEARPQRRYAW